MSGRANKWWWTEQAPNVEPIDWEAFDRSARIAFAAAAEQWSKAKAANVAFISENAGTFALLAAVAAFCGAAPGATAPSPKPAEPQSDPEIRDAAALVGVSLPSTVAEIQRAFRQKLISERIHPDHGGDAEQTKRLIAARDLLVARFEVKS